MSNSEQTPTTPIETRGWALQRADGTIYVEIGSDAYEGGVWRIGLGWPSKEEIEWQKQRGARAFPCEIREVKA